MNLPATQLDLVKELAGQGLQPVTIARTLGIESKDWRELLQPPEPGAMSPLALALLEGEAMIADCAIAVCLEQIRAGDPVMAKWWLEKFAPQQKREGGGSTTNNGVTIIIRAAMDEQTYRQVYVEQGGEE